MTAPDETRTEIGAATGDTLSMLAGTWTLDPDHSSIVFTTKAMWLFPVRGTSFDTNNKKRDKHLRSADFFEVDTYPTFTYSVTGARSVNAGRFELEGTLTIRQQSRPLKVTADVQATGTTATVTAEVDIDRSVWGLTWAKLGASVANHVVIQARFNKA